MPGTNEQPNQDITTIIAISTGIEDIDEVVRRCASSLDPLPTSAPHHNFFITKTRKNDTQINNPDLGDNIENRLS
jgi:hypothetical protein